ncbi:arginine--tRNA ligase [Candidatus Saccharibacteria bacterium]|jgi:arginyl-tRNA synthetase|nr:arginine--tRNA ligase [Candidatus Saccharibacteria bacterium]
MTEEIKGALSEAVKVLFDVDAEPELSRPEERFGDYASNVALQLAGKLSKNPREIAEALAEKLQEDGQFEKIEVAGAGFINITLKNESLINALQTATQLPKTLEGQEILVEFGDPNPFKEMHIGHLYSYITGDSISKLLEAGGASVRRLSYHGDVGLHVAKAIWGMQHQPAGQELGVYYAAGANAYEDNPEAKAQIEQINEHVYKKDDEQINGMYEQGRQASFEYFDNILTELGVRNDRRYLESESADTGLDFVRQHTGSVFKESQGAIIYDGEKVGLHTRVFITSKGLPTYETKDLGLAELKNQDYPAAARSIIITAHEQSEYFKVMLAALAEFDAPLAKKTTHLAHGFLSLSTGKMSSRTGEVYSAESLLRDVQGESKKLYPDSSADTYLAAVKYGFLKHRLGSDIVYDVAESVSLEGNSGPYLQYAHARARSILGKAQGGEGKITGLDSAERSLSRKISEYPEAAAKATAELMPHHIANYLYELAQSFNRFYEGSRVIGDARELTRLQLIGIYADVLKNGLELLNIVAPEHV